MPEKRKAAALEVRRAFARRLAMARELANFRDKGKAAAALGIEGERYRRWERAETEPSLAQLARIAEVFAISLDTLVLGEHQPKGETIHFRDAAKKISRA